MARTLIATMFLAAAILWAGVAAAQGVAGGSVWVNQRGSTLNITAVSNGQITGTYINRAVGFGCQNSPYRVVGWVLGTAITFTVMWTNNVETCNSITAWTGFFYAGRITTEWQLVISGTTDPSRIVKGQDIFTPQ